MPNANSPKHKTIVKSAIKRLKANVEAQKEGGAVRHHMFYVLSNRANKSAIVHLGLKPGKEPDKVKNPKSIRNHLKAVVGDKKEEGLEKLLDLKAKDITDQHLRKLSSCAGKVHMIENTIHFDISERQGGGTASDLTKALKGLKALFGDCQIEINNQGSGAVEDETDADAAPSTASAADKLAAFQAALSGGNLEGDGLFEAMDKAGVSFADLDEMGDKLDANVRRLIDTVNAQFDTPGDPFQDRVENILEIGAELAIDSWGINMSKGQADVERQKSELEALKTQLQASPNMEITFEGKILKQRHGGPTVMEQLTELIDSAEEALILLDFGSPEDLRKTLMESFGESGRDTVVRQQDALNQAAKTNRTIEDGLTEDEILMPMPHDSNERYKLLMVKLLTDTNTQIIESLMHDVDLEFTTDSGDSRKDPENIVLKAHRPDVTKGKEDWIGVEHIRDSFRFKTVVDDIKKIPKIFQKLVDAGISLVKIDTDKLFKPKGFGWRIIAFDLRMPNGQIVEWYLPIAEMEAEKKKPEFGHEIFERWRIVPVDDFEVDIASMKAKISEFNDETTTLPFKKKSDDVEVNHTKESLGALLRETVANQTSYQEDMTKSKGGYDAAFETAWKRMGYKTEKEMKNDWDRCVSDINSIADSAK